MANENVVNDGYYIGLKWFIANESYIIGLLSPMAYEKFGTDSFFFLGLFLLISNPNVASENYFVAHISLTAD